MRTPLRSTSRQTHRPAVPAARLLLALLLTASALPARATDFYVSPTATASGTGSVSNPWRLQTALSQPSAVHPGDTIWLRGGTYTGTFDSHLTGNSTSPIVVRSYPGEFARIDGAPADTTILQVDGAYTVYQDFEVMSSSNPSPDGGQGSRPQGLQIFGASNKFINLLVHDTGQGFGFWEGAPNSEISGCLIYYNGNSQLDHGIYTQNVTGTKALLDNIVFRNYGFGIHAYATNAHLNNYDIERNVSFDNGKLNASQGYKSNFLLGAGQSAGSSCTSSPQVAQNPIFANNYAYDPRGTGGRALDLGYSTGSCNPTASGNYLVGDTTLTLGPAFGAIAITGNTFYGPVSGFSGSGYPSNSYTSSRPATTQVFLHPNLHETGRANIVVFNWANQSSVDVDVTGIVPVDAGYELRDAQNFANGLILSGTASPTVLSIPMGGLTPATPVGHPTPAATGPDFNVFVLRSVPGPWDFWDVPFTSMYRPFVNKIAKDGITAGCGLKYFCPDTPVTRAQMAVFLLRGEHGAVYSPPAATGTVFTDVPATAFAAAWIERLSAESISTGCGGRAFCPNSSVTRAQMAVFLLRAKLGPTYTPPAAVGIFSDVPATDPYARWIEDLYLKGISAGCGVAPLRYCPTTVVTRAQMAVFLVTAFGLT